MDNENANESLSLIEQLQVTCSEHHAEQASVEGAIKALHQIVEEISQSWSGSWIGHHAYLYYKDFERPPSEHRFDVEWGTARGLAGTWYEVQFDGMQKVIETQEGAAKLDELFDMARSQRVALTALQEDIAIELSPIRGRKGFESEEELLDDLERHSWGLAADDIVRYQMPKTWMTRDQRAMAEGIKVPPHIMYDSKVLAVQSAFKANEDFCKKARRVLRQVVRKEEVVEIGRIANSDEQTSGPLVQICKGFHRMARQLRDRHSNRPTLEVNDEYDVQDLLHAVLRMHFEDVRPEEYTPSYAGGNSRVDFLLKRERVVIEVKKTRSGLTDKTLGEQLIIDIARYQTHPDCDLLICFVYDPEGRIGNPRGLESDLSKLGNEKLEIVVFIEPS